MKVLYILDHLNRTAPNTVIINIILTLKHLLNDCFIISVTKSHHDNYRYLLKQHHIKFQEFESYQECVLSIKNILQIAKDYNIIHLNQYKSNELGNLIQKFNYNIPIISTCHSIEDEEMKARGYKGEEKRIAAIRLREQANFYQKHTKVIAVSNAVESYLHKIGCKNTSIIYNGIDTQNTLKQSVIKSHKKTSDLIKFVQVGHIMPLKNQLYSLKLIHWLKKRNLNVELHFFGQDAKPSYKKQLLQYIDKYDLNNIVFFYGNIPFKELFPKLQQMDILLMPSLTEGFPLSLLEAFYFELPAIVSTNGGMKEVVEDNITGLSININNTQDFKKIFTYCKTMKFIQNGKNAKKLILKKFSSIYSSKRYFNEYKKLIKSDALL